MSKAAQNRESLPLSRLKARGPADPQGNRQQRRRHEKLDTVEVDGGRPATAEEIFERIVAIPNWRTIPEKELGRLIGRSPVIAGRMRRVIAADLDIQAGKLPAKKKPRKKRK